MEMTNINRKGLQNSLLRWFEGNGRDLPWRSTYDPYHVWLSEIMLQQTQMDRGVDYFLKWIERFPSVTAIADSDLREVLKYWEGLGYYARARNLHKAAQILRDKYNGRIPGDYDQLLSLPGVGPYTASAISSIAFELDIPVIDANVERVFSRLFDIDKPLKTAGVKEQIHSAANFLLPKGKARYFNQALMDLGGLICSPRKVQCGICPLSDYCLAYERNCVDERPVKSGGKKTIHIEMATGLLIHDGHVFIQQRNDDDIWGGLWEFPGGRLKEKETPEDAVIREYFEETQFKVAVDEKITTVVHHHTKYKVTLHCFLVSLDQKSTLPSLTDAQTYHWVTHESLANYAFPAGHRKYISFIQEKKPEILRNRNVKK